MQEHDNMSYAVFALNPSLSDVHDILSVRGQLCVTLTVKIWGFRSYLGLNLHTYLRAL